MIDKTMLQSERIETNESLKSRAPLREHLHGARAALNSESRDDRRRRSAAKATGRVERIDAEELVDQAARDAKHGRAAILTLRVELERANFRIVVAHLRSKVMCHGDGCRARNPAALTSSYMF